MLRMHISHQLPSDPATKYADDVLSGKVIAGEFVRAAAKRHFDDLANGSSRGLYFDAKKAEHALNFYPTMLSITDGDKAGQPFTLLPWHAFCVASLFGWRRSDNLRRFRMAWFETGKGQAKSPLMAGTGLYLLGFCGRQRPEVYSIAGDKDQANVLFKDGVAMCRAPIPGYEDEPDNSLEAKGIMIIRGVGDNAWKIECPATQGRFQSIASQDAISGPRPYGVLADEIHEMKTVKPIQLWKAAIDKISGDPIMILGTNTPAADQTVGTEYSEITQKIVTGQAVDDSWFGYIARVDKDDKPLEDESCWSKSLPALGITYPIDNVRNRVVTAKLLASEKLATLRLYFGVPVGTSEFWIEEEPWKNCQGTVDPSDHVGDKCWLSLDLSKKNDLTALSAVWKKNGKLFEHTWYFTTLDHLKDREIDDHEPYSLWVEEGLIIAVPGAVIDFEFVAAKIKEICAVHDVQFLAFDSAMIETFIKACDNIGFPVWRHTGSDEGEGEGLKLVSHAQGTKASFKDGVLSMPKSVVALEDAILSEVITINRSKVTEMCARNAFITTDAMNNKAFDKKRSRGRIDGLVTIAMATGSATSEIEAEKSFWEVT